MTKETNIPSIDEIITEEWEYVSRYSRSMALADGVLIDVTEQAKLFGFTLPVAITDGAYVDAVIEYCRGTNTQEAARLNAVLMTVRDAIRSKIKHASDRVYFRLPTADAEGTYYHLTLIAHCGPGDSPAPVITIMRPEDD